MSSGTSAGLSCGANAFAPKDATEETTMTTEALSVTTTVPAAADAVFTVLTDPTQHAAVDGTGWVRAALDVERLTTSGQVFRMSTFHRDHPDGGYEIANRVRELDLAKAISWEPGTEDADGRLSLGGWTWRYDLAPAAGGTQVRLTYDWSRATPQA